MPEPNWTKEPPRKILLATDMSARCDRALDRATSLARIWQAQLVAVHALEQHDEYIGDLERHMPSWRRPPDMVRIVEDRLRWDLLEAGDHVTAIVEKGAPTDIILRVGERHACDLIVTGLARDETLTRFGLGSTVARLLRRSRAPVLNVRQRARAPYKNVVVASDFSESSRYALKAAMAIFPDQKLDIFHAYDAPMSRMMGDSTRYHEEYRDAAANECAAFLDQVDISSIRRQSIGLQIEAGRPSHLIPQYARDHGIDLVVLGTHGRSALFDVFIGSTAKDILSSLACDALIVRAPRSAVEGEARS